MTARPSCDGGNVPRAARRARPRSQTAQGAPPLRVRAPSPWPGRMLRASDAATDAGPHAFRSFDSPRLDLAGPSQFRLAAVAVHRVGNRRPETSAPVTLQFAADLRLRSKSGRADFQGSVKAIGKELQIETSFQIDAAFDASAVRGDARRCPRLDHRAGLRDGRHAWDLQGAPSPPSASTTTGDHRRDHEPPVHTSASTRTVGARAVGSTAQRPNRDLARPGPVLVEYSAVQHTRDSCARSRRRISC